MFMFLSYHDIIQPIHFTLQNGDTALTLASFRGHVDVVQILLLHNADVNAPRPVRVVFTVVQ